MSEEVSLTEVVENVGETIFNQLEANEASILGEETKQWMCKRGISRAENPERVLSNLAAFNWLLKTTLYEIYRSNGAQLEPLDEESDIYACLVKAFAETQDRAFKENTLDGLIESLDCELFRPLLDVRDCLLTTSEPIEDVGRLFEVIVPQKARRKLGQFRTPRYIGEFMAKWAIQNPDDVVLDPGIGAGVLTACMYSVKRSHADEANVDEIWGIDLDELAVVMSSTALKLTNGEGSPNFITDNFMDTIVEDATTRIDQKNPHSLPQMDAIVSNPPYSRSHELSSDEKQRINRIAEAEADMPISQKAPMYHYFYIHATQFLKIGGRMAFITPALFLQTNYGVQLREFLLENFAIHSLILLDNAIPVFEEADTDLCIAFLERAQQPNPEQSVTLMQLEKWPGDGEVLNSIEGDTEGTQEYGYINKVKQHELLPEFNWTDYFDPETVDSIKGLTPFHEIATIKRGIATGMNEYFCLSPSEAKEWGLPEEYLVPIIRRTSSITGFDFRDSDLSKLKSNDDSVLLLYCYDEEGEPIRNVEDEVALSEYLSHGEEIGAAQRYLAENRSPWYVVDNRDPAPILVTYMSKGGFRFIHNKAGVRTLNNLHVADVEGYSNRQIEALLAYLNSSVADAITKRSGRTYSRGLHKIEPNELKQIPVIDPDELSTEEVNVLSNRFRDMCEESRINDGEIDSAVAELDKSITRILRPREKSRDISKQMSEKNPQQSVFGRNRSP